MPSVVDFDAGWEGIEKAREISRGAETLLTFEVEVVLVFLDAEVETLLVFEVEVEEVEETPLVFKVEVEALVEAEVEVEALLTL